MSPLLTRTGRLPRAIIIVFLLVAFSTAIAQADRTRADKECDPQAISPRDGVIKLYNGKNFDGLTTWLSDDKHDNSRGVFSINDGIIHITGNGFGYVRTNKRYRDYHLIVEFKWGERTWLHRKKGARDSGVIVHCTGPDGGCSNVFMAGIEAQIIEGGTGDFIAVDGVDVDGTKIPASISVETEKDRDGELVWKAGGKPATVTDTTMRINWFGRDPDWKDEVGFRGKDDVESPFGQWTRMDVICEGSRVTIAVNGVVVNKGFDASMTEGQILLQTEGAEIFVRRWELWPLGKAPE